MGGAESKGHSFMYNVLHVPQIPGRDFVCDLCAPPAPLPDCGGPSPQIYIGCDWKDVKVSFPMMKNPNDTSSILPQGTVPGLIEPEKATEANTFITITATPSPTVTMPAAQAISNEQTIAPRHVQIAPQEHSFNIPPMTKFPVPVPTSFDAYLDNIDAFVPGWRSDKEIDASRITEKTATDAELDEEANNAAQADDAIVKGSVEVTKEEVMQPDRKRTHPRDLGINFD